jgi:hypothetical protein
MDVIRGIPMQPVKTLDQRQSELQEMLTTSVGRAQLRDLQSRYEAETGKLNPVGKSIITFILTSERASGLISG